MKKSSQAPKYAAIIVLKECYKVKNIKKLFGETPFAVASNLKLMLSSEFVKHTMTNTISNEN